jgi:hypothetical protein
MMPSHRKDNEVVQARRLRGRDAYIIDRGLGQTN